MESTTTDEQFFGAGASLSEPHFDEEATVLSARPVVPLTTIKGANEVKSVTPVRPWILVLALVGTLLVGIFATAVYYSRGNSSDYDAKVGAGGEADATRSADSFSGPAPDQPVVNTDKTSAVTAARKSEAAPNRPATPSAEPANKPAPRLVAVIREKGSRESIEESREDRKAARRQARQERRQADRERRGAGSSDDLLRIRDIFEGSPRP